MRRIRLYRVFAIPLISSTEAGSSVDGAVGERAKEAFLEYAKIGHEYAVHEGAFELDWIFSTDSFSKFFRIVF